MRFLDLTMADNIPDSRTVWAFREQITNPGLVEQLFNLFFSELDKLGLIVNEGKIIDASFVEVPRQRNTRAENEQIKKGETPESFNKNPHRKSHKDVDARWTRKNNVNYSGYKSHVKSDAESKLITKYMVTDASVHDSNATAPLLDENDKGEPFYADSAYTDEPQEKIIAGKEMINQVCEKGYRNKPLIKCISTLSE